MISKLWRCYQRQIQDRVFRRIALKARHNQQSSPIIIINKGSALVSDRDTAIVIGGRQKRRSNLEEWHQFESARLLRVDLATGAVLNSLDYVSPPEVCPDRDPSILFKSGSLAGDTLLLCTQTEVVIADADTFEIRRIWSHPYLNDVHHVLSDGEGGFYVAVTGLDLVLQVNAAGDLVKEWSTVPGEEPFARFDRSIDYRKVATTKPHLTHPNFVFELNGELWVTRNHPCDALCLTADLPRMVIEVEKPHDGHVEHGKVFFTTVDSHVVVFDAQTLDRTNIYNLNRMGDFASPLGWCRGLKLLDENRALIGFSRLRRTKFSDNLTWLKKRVAAARPDGSVFIPPSPTGIRCFNLAKGTMEYSLSLEDHGMNAVFSVL